MARIYDPRRAEIYQRLGIPTVATVAWTAGQILRQMLPLGAEEEYRDATGELAVAEVHLGATWIGCTVDALEAAAPARVAFLSRLGAPVVPSASTVLQEGDLVHAAYRVADRAAVERAFEHGADA